jgi:transposase
MFRRPFVLSGGQEELAAKQGRCEEEADVVTTKGLAVELRIGQHGGMYLRRCYRETDGKRHSYWALVESYRTVRGPRQRVVAWLGAMDEAGRMGVKRCALGEDSEPCDLFVERGEPEWVEVDLKRVRVERTRRFGGPWLGRVLLRELELDRVLEEILSRGREQIPWPLMAMVLVLGRLSDPSSELRLAEHVYEHSALPDVLGVPASKVNEDRLYRALDALLPHKAELEAHLRQKLGELFSLDYDLLLYDVTSTYFEGEAKANPLAQRGYSRDHRPDCKQVNLALVVSRSGMPVGYEVFAGNRHDATTLEQIIEHIERLHGRAARIWVLDRGMVSEENVAFLKQGGRRYIVGTPKSMLKRYERELLTQDWRMVHEGLEVRLCPAPDSAEVFILCRSAERRQKEQAIHARFEKRIEEGLRKLETACQKQRQNPLLVARRVGRLLGHNTRTAGLFQVEVEADRQGAARLRWTKSEAWRDWARLSEGCYLLRSNVIDWTPEELWRAYMQLTQAEDAFHIQKSDLQIRPVWHQKAERVQAHILVCFLAYVLRKTLEAQCRQAGLGDEPRKVFAELSEITLVDVILPTRNGVTLRKRCISQPNQHQLILLERLGLRLPAVPEFAPM